MDLLFNKFAAAVKSQAHRIVVSPVLLETSKEIEDNLKNEIAFVDPTYRGMQPIDVPHSPGERMVVDHELSDPHDCANCTAIVALDVPVTMPDSKTVEYVDRCIALFMQRPLPVEISSDDEADF